MRRKDRPSKSFEIREKKSLKRAFILEDEVITRIVIDHAGGNPDKALISKSFINNDFSNYRLFYDEVYIGHIARDFTDTEFIVKFTEP